MPTSERYGYFLYTAAEAEGGTAQHLLSPSTPPECEMKYRSEISVKYLEGALGISCWAPGSSHLAHLHPHKALALSCSLEVINHKQLLWHGRARECHVLVPRSLVGVILSKECCKKGAF